MWRSVALAESATLCRPCLDYDLTVDQPVWSQLLNNIDHLVCRSGRAPEDVRPPACGCCGDQALARPPAACMSLYYASHSADPRQVHLTPRPWGRSALVP